MTEVSLTRFKTCTKCSVTYPATSDYFRFYNRTKKQLMGACIACKRLYGRRHYYDNQQAYIDKSRDWYEANKKRAHAASAKWIAENKDKAAFYVWRWAQVNKDRRRLSTSLRRARICSQGGNMEFEDIWRMYDSQGGLCAYCEFPLFGEFELDHMVPVSRGGGSDWQNMAVSCSSCNRRKSSKTAVEFWAVLTS